jgi:hypothetical protein
MLGDGGGSIDVMVVAEGLVLLGEQAGADAHAPLLHGQFAKVTFQHQVLGRYAFGLDDEQRIDKTHLVDS